MNRTKGELKIDGLFLYCEDHNGRRTYVCKMDNVSALTKEMLLNAHYIIKGWNEYDKLKAKEASHDALLARETVLVDAMAEIKAIMDDPKKYYEQHETKQTVKDIVVGCLKELAAIAEAEKGT